MGDTAADRLVTLVQAKAMDTLEPLRLEVEFVQLPAAHRAMLWEAVARLAWTYSLEREERRNG